MELLDRLELQKAMDAVIYGNNKKRRRGEMEGTDDLDEDSKRK